MENTKGCFRTDMLIVGQLNLLNFYTITFQRTASTASQSEAGSSTAGETSKTNQHPQTLEELLERQWEQGSQFLMEQASHFDSKFLEQIIT